MSGGRNPNDAAFAITGNDIRNGWSYLHTAALAISAQDMRAWELLSDVPIVHNIVGYVVFAFNLVLPGTGTVIAAVVAESYMANKTQILVGLFQLLTSLLATYLHNRKRILFHASRG